MYSVHGSSNKTAVVLDDKTVLVDFAPYELRDIGQEKGAAILGLPSQAAWPPRIVGIFPLPLPATSVTAFVLMRLSRARAEDGVEKICY